MGDQQAARPVVDPGRLGGGSQPQAPRQTEAQDEQDAQHDAAATPCVERVAVRHAGPPKSGCDCTCRLGLWA